jgi:hypothetical protein
MADGIFWIHSHGILNKKKKVAYDKDFRNHCKFIYRQVFSELRRKCMETEVAVSGDGGGGKWRWR